MGLVKERPFSFGMTDIGVHAARLKRFPYVIYFSCSELDDEIVVHAVMFGGRDSSAWTDRV